ncbi:50S ribosomal protein L17 [Candidatus Margulisiibacteriota bacterium]
MRHRKGNTKLSKPTDQRMALIRNLSIQLLQYETVKTTKKRAKAVQRYLDKLFTIAKKDTLASRRLVFTRLANKKAVQNVFKHRKGFTHSSGFVRVLNMPLRLGDASPQALLMIGTAKKVVESDDTKKKKSKIKTKRKK